MQHLTTPELHAVFATDYEHKTYRVSDPAPGNEPWDEWQRLDDLRRAKRMPHVKFYEVRSVTLGPDRALVGPEVRSHDRYDRAPFSWLLRTPVVEGSRGFADDGKHRWGREESGEEKVARAAWKRFAPTYRVPAHKPWLSGEQGYGGWFYYPNGVAAAQGLSSLFHLCVRKNLVVEGGDGRWYVLDHEHDVSRVAATAAA